MGARWLIGGRAEPSKGSNFKEGGYVKVSHQDGQGTVSRIVWVGVRCAHGNIID